MADAPEVPRRAHASVTTLEVELVPLNGKVGFTITGGKLTADNVGFDPSVSQT